jgi:hypothetical protein
LSNTSPDIASVRPTVVVSASHCSNQTIVLIVTTFFLVNKFKDRLAPIMFPAKMDKDSEASTAHLTE